ncbi:hypothetical protein NLJ89_g3732 [Agrocybe chaxingu]|uniref:Uncharacterized protein n=1 Tax=Agrocybe chaxingu TaxID=84603 RepID=A0A9W8K494_9AGAR|nr:hypothetical protein NLJ89_g3732 [Agrocybe chaxingu]
MEAIRVVHFRCRLETVVEESESESTLDVRLARRRTLRSYRGRKLTGITLRNAYEAPKRGASAFTTLPSAACNDTPPTPLFQPSVGRHRPPLQTHDGHLGNAPETYKRSTSSTFLDYTSLSSCQPLYLSSYPPLPPPSSTSPTSAIQTLEDPEDSEHPVTLWTLFTITALGYFLFFLLFVVCFVVVLWRIFGWVWREEVVDEGRD